MLISESPAVFSLLQLARRLATSGDDGGAPIARNNVGFSGADYPLVTGMLAGIDRQNGRVTARQIHTIANRLEKYGRQAASLGYDLPELLERMRKLHPVEPPHAQTDIGQSSEFTSSVSAHVRQSLQGSTEDDIQAAIIGVLEASWYQGPPPDSERPPVGVFQSLRERFDPYPRPDLSMLDILGPDGLFAGRLPGYQARQPQIDLAESINTALKAGTPLLAEAGTGTGKSFAYLIPAILSGEKTIVSTEGKALQDQLVGKDLPFLAHVLPVRFSYAKLKGLGNYVCRDKLEESAGQASLFGDTNGDFARVQQWVRELDADDPSNLGDIVDAPITVTNDLAQRITSTSDECTGTACAYHKTCFAMRARAAAREADILVVNHTLLALDVNIRRMSDDAVSILPDRAQIVIDEAHTLEDVATNALTREASSGRIASVTRGKWAAMAEFTPAHIAGAVQASDTFFQTLDRAIGREHTTAIIGATPAVVDAARDVSIALAPLIRLAERASHDASAGEQVRAKMARFLERIEKVNEIFTDLAGDTVGEYDVIYGEREETRRGGGTRILLKIAPVSVAAALKVSLWDKWPVIATSATLTAAPVESGGSPFGYFRDRCGVPDCTEFQAASPFDYKRNALLYLPSPGFNFDPSKFYQSGSVEYYDRISATITDLLLASAGRAFVLFTSRKAMLEVHGRIAGRLAWNVLVQGDASTQELIRRFKADTHSVLFGLKSFWTGVDVQGSALSLVIIDKLPFPTPDDPVFKARCEAVNKAFGDKWAWFNRLAIPMASQAIAQGVGRLIRNSTDTGVIALLDGRLTSKNYGPSILRVLPPATQTRSLEAVTAFFQANGGGG